MVHMTESTFLSSDGKTNIYYREYIPSGEPKGIVQLSHGIVEYIARYDDFARFLCENGYIVAGNDHIGHGQSTNAEDLGWAGEVGGWETMVEDTNTLHKLLRHEHPGLPCYLLGHSMGSFVARCFIIRFRGSLDGVILSGTGHQSPALVKFAVDTCRTVCKQKGSRFKSKLLNDLIFGSNNRGYENARTAYDWLSRDEAIVDQYIHDPLCGFVPTAGLCLDMMEGIAFMTKPRNMERMSNDLPVYFLSGSKDPIGENGRGVMRAYKAFLKAGMRDVTMKLYTDARHEILNEINKQEVYEDILNWLNAKSGKTGN